jgi:ISXO2 transposase-like protein
VPQNLHGSCRTAEAPYGIPEVDETWVGGKDSNQHWDKKHHGKTGRAGSGKLPVIGAVSRKGKRLLPAF